MCVCSRILAFFFQFNVLSLQAFINIKVILNPQKHLFYLKYFELFKDLLSSLPTGKDELRTTFPPCAILFRHQSHSSNRFIDTSSGTACCPYCEEVAGTVSATHESTAGHRRTRQSAWCEFPRRQGIQGQDVIKLIILLLHHGYAPVELAFYLASSF